MRLSCRTVSLIARTDEMMSAAPPTNESAIHQWTVGPLFYSTLVVAEALGTSNTSQVKDLLPDGNDLTPAYAIYENGNLARMALINFMTDPSGANDVVATVNIGGQQFGEANSVPAQAKVKWVIVRYLTGSISALTQIDSEDTCWHRQFRRRTISLGQGRSVPASRSMSLL